jgi:hypothetical protein
MNEINAESIQASDFGVHLDLQRNTTNHIELKARLWQWIEFVLVNEGDSRLNKSTGGADSN